MNVVDSSGWLEYFSDGPNASFFARPLSDPSSLIVPSISIFEVFKRILQQRDETSALESIALMQQGRVVALDASLAISAAKLSFDKKMPLADTIILKTAEQYSATLWSQDDDFKDIAGVKYVAKVQKSA